MLTQEYLKSILHYDPETGIFTWKKKIANSIIVGRPAGNSNDYCQISIHKKAYLAHRLAFLYCHGYLPEIVDHINRNTRDNRLSNLRAATFSTSCANRKLNHQNKTGYKGVKRRKNGRYIARICKDGKRLHVGTFDTPEEAYDAYCVKGYELFGSFFCSG